MVFSDITISFNDRDGLKITLDSFLKQKFKDYQVIVVDGGSNDGTLELLEEYKTKFDIEGVGFEYVSEKDSGRYNAMNKGIAMAKGDWLLFMNAGDILASSDTLESVADFVNSDSKSCDVVYGDNLRIFGEERVVRKAAVLKSIEKGLPFCHQSVFVRREQMTKRGYDESFVISGDYEWFLYAYKKGMTFGYIPKIISIYDTNGISSYALYKTYKEALRIRNRYGVSDSTIVRLVKGFIWKVLDVFKVSRKQIDTVTLKMRNNGYKEKN